MSSSRARANDILDSVTPSSRAVDVFLQDQTTQPVDLYFSEAVSAPVLLVLDSNIGDTEVVVSDDSNFSVDGYIGLFSGASLENRFYFGVVTGKPGGNVLTLDTPLDFAFQTGDLANPLSRDLNVDGSSTSRVFSIAGPGAGGLAIDITKIRIVCEASSAVDLSKFGDLSKLSKGLVLRRNNGYITNILNVKTNGELTNFGEWLPYVATNPAQGVDGFSWTYRLSGQSNRGVVVRLVAGEALELIIQDKLDGLSVIRAIASGHVVE